MMLRREFANAVGYLNNILPEDSRLKFIHWDFHKFAKRFASWLLLGFNGSEALFITTRWNDSLQEANLLVGWLVGGDCSKSANVLAVLGAVASEALDLTGIYYSGKPSIAKRRGRLQRSSTTSM